MTNKKLRKNYTSICHHCGVIFKNNRRTGFFCCPQHRSLNGAIGSIISPMVPDEHGNDFNAEVILEEIYAHAKDIQVHEDGWSIGYKEEDLNRLFGYYGPFPTGSHLLVVSSYLVKMEELDPEEEGLAAYFFFKPISLLSTPEKATATFISMQEGQLEEESETRY